jgi:hypothetical protein
LQNPFKLFLNIAHILPLRLHQGLRVQIQPFFGFIWPLRGLAQNGEGINMGPGSPCPAVWGLVFCFGCEILPKCEIL